MSMRLIAFLWMVFKQINEHSQQHICNDLWLPCEAISFSGERFPCYHVCMNPAANIFLIGPMGAGKSTIGRRVADLLGLAFYDLDNAIEERWGADISLIFEIEGEIGFRRRESVLLNELTAWSNIVLATGGGVVLTPVNRQRLMQRGFVVYLQPTIEQQLARLRRDRKRPLLTTVDRRERLEQLAMEREPLYREIADMTLSTANMYGSPQMTARQLLYSLEMEWQRVAVPSCAV